MAYFHRSTCTALEKRSDLIDGMNRYSSYLLRMKFYLTKIWTSPKVCILRRRLQDLKKAIAMKSGTTEAAIDTTFFRHLNPR